MREWLVIENAHARAVFRDDDEPRIFGYIPREAAEAIVGEPIENDRHFWFSREQSEQMRAHPEWRDELPGHLTQDQWDDLRRDHLDDMIGQEP